MVLRERDGSVSPNNGKILTNILWQLYQFKRHKIETALLDLACMGTNRKGRVFQKMRNLHNELEVH